MSHERLWAPWRLAYIKGVADDARPAPQKTLALLPGADADCFLCRAVADDDDRTNLVVHRGPHTIAVLNRYPYNNGHVLVAPRTHHGRLDQLADEVHIEAVLLLSRLVQLQEHGMNAQGFNIGLNLGHAGGAGVPGHLHWHLVPRWSGDTNFMPVLGGAKVISQSLDALWELLTQALASTSSDSAPIDNPAG